MKKLAWLLPVVAFSFFVMAFTGSAYAQASRTWVSGVGDDANPCSRTAPCKTFAGSISKTATNGEINCLDPGGFGSVTIVKSITIDCHEVFASVLNAGTNGIVINFDSFSVADTRKTVRIRNINLNGFDTGINGIRIVGGAASAGSAVFIEDVLIDGNFGGAAHSISEERTGGGELTVSRTTTRNAGAGCIALVGAAATRIDATFNDVRIQNCNNGISVATGAFLTVTGAILSGNTGSGVSVGGASTVNIDNSIVSDNGTGISVAGGGTVRLSNTNLTFNTTAISGTTLSFGSNRIAGNTSDGTAPTLIAPNNTNPSGQK